MLIQIPFKAHKPFLNRFSFIFFYSLKYLCKGFKLNVFGRALMFFICCAVFPIQCHVIYLMLFWSFIYHNNFVFDYSQHSVIDDRSLPVFKSSYFSIKWPLTFRLNFTRVILGHFSVTQLISPQTFLPSQCLGTMVVTILVLYCPNICRLKFFKISTTLFTLLLQ